MAFSDKYFFSLLFFITISFLAAANAVIFNVKSFGATGDGVTDDTQAFINAWQRSCNSRGATFMVPKQNVFLIRKITFHGVCQPELLFQIDGTIIAPDEPDKWPADKRKDPWIVFEKIDGMQLQGSGVIDGRGQKWWELSCKPHRGNGTQSGPCDSPPAIRFNKCSHLLIQGLKIKNSPQFHIKFDSCENIHIESLTIKASYESPNTDGIHLEKTNDVRINNSIISSGDDCVSIGANVSNVNINNLTCGPSHGISIGSLGNQHSRACVSNIIVTNSVIKQSDNGVRIKTWQGGFGSVFNVTFRDIQVENVRYPIIIDQYYCATKNCKNESSAIKINDILYENIKGIYGTKNGKSLPIRFECSDTIPCTNLKLADIELHPASGEMIRDPFCWKARGKILTSTVPAVNCLDGHGFPFPIKRKC